MTADLRAYLAQTSAGRIRYGRHDCLIFVVRWVRERTGRDMLEGHAYTSLRAGRALLARHGLADHVAVVARALPQIAVLRARAGDVAVLDGVGMDALGIVAPGGERVAVLGRGGVALLPLTDANKIFGVT